MTYGQWSKLLIQEGKKRGNLEGKLETAKNLLVKGVSLELIIEVTGLKKQQLENYIKS